MKTINLAGLASVLMLGVSCQTGLETVTNEDGVSFSQFHGKSWAVLPAVNGGPTHEYASLLNERWGEMGARLSFIARSPAEVQATLDRDPEALRAAAAIAGRIHLLDADDKKQVRFGSGVNARLQSAYEYSAEVDEWDSLVTVSAKPVEGVEAEAKLLAEKLKAEVLVVPYISHYTPMFSRTQYWCLVVPFWMSKSSRENVFVNFYVFDLKSGKNVFVVKTTRVLGSLSRSGQLDDVFERILQIDGNVLRKFERSEKKS